MPTPPSHTGPVTLADWTRTPAPSVLRQSPVTLEGDFSGSGNGWKGTVDYRVPIKDIYDFAQFCGGNPYTVGTGLVRYVPLSHPDAPSLICTNVQVTVKGGYTTPAAYTEPPTAPTVTTSNWSDAVFHLTFTSVPYPTDGSSAFMEVNREGSTEEVSIPGVKWVFPSDGTIVPSDITVKVAQIVLSVTVYLAYSVDDTFLAPLAGSVNSDTCLGFAPGYLRFDTYSSRTTMTAGGAVSYTLTLLLTFRSVPWVQILRANGVWEAPTKPGGGFLYASNALSPIFSTGV